MITGDDDVEIHALKKRGWKVADIARHVGHDPKTVRAYLDGERTPGKRKPAKPDKFIPFVAYLTARFAEDPHVWATALFDEVCVLGFDLSYQTFTKQLRDRGLRPHCEACSGVKGRATIEIHHPPGEEIQWDWLELPDAPWGGDAHVLVASLPFSGKFRGIFADFEDQPHLIEGIHGVLERFGGTPRSWRVDRMATVINPATGNIQRSFLPVAKHYGVSIVACPPRRANRKASVEKSIHYLTQRWWRTAAVTTMAQAQMSFDRFCETTADARKRPIAKIEVVSGIVDIENLGQMTVRPTVRELAGYEPLQSLPTLAYPSTIEVTPRVGDSCLVAFRGNHYDVPAGMMAHEVTVRYRLGATTIQIFSGPGTIVATHRLAPNGSGAIVCDTIRHADLQNVVLGSFTTNRPCVRKANIGPGEGARAQAAKLLGHMGAGHDEVVVDLLVYEAIANGDKQ